MRRTISELKYKDTTMSGDTPTKTTKPRTKKAVAPVTPYHQWTHDGTEVLIVKCVAADGATYSGNSRQGNPVSFRWPLEVGATVEADDWIADSQCGGGLHGWAWGIGIGDGKQPDWRGTWIVFSADPAEVIRIEAKVKTRRGTIRFVGKWQDALAFVRPGRFAWAAQSGSAASSGDSSSAASSGNSSSAASSGYSSSAASSGDSSSAASSGDSSSAASSGDSSSAQATGLASPAVCAGINSKAQSGPYGCIALQWLNAHNRREMRCAEVGCGDGSDGKLKAATWYVLDAGGQFVEAKS